MAESPRTRIMHAAMSLFLANGVNAVRTSEICRNAGVSNGSLFHFFPTKKSIAVALYVDAIDGYQRALLRELNRNATARETIKALVHAHWDWVRNNQTAAQFLFEMGRPSFSNEANEQVAELNLKLETAYSRWWGAARSTGEVVEMPLAAARAVLLGPSILAMRHWLREIAENTPNRPRDAPHDLATDFAKAAIRSLVTEQRNG